MRERNPASVYKTIQVVLNEFARFP